MIDWLADNWLVLLGAILYVIERATGIGAQWKKRARILSEAIERQATLGTDATAKDLLPSYLRGDTLLDSVLDDGVQPKTPRRVKWPRRIGRALLNALPVVTRILDRSR